MNVEKVKALKFFIPHPQPIIRMKSIYFDVKE